MNPRRLALWLLSAYALWQFADAISAALLLFALTALVTLVLDPPVRWLDRRGLSRGVSVSIMALALLGAFLVIAVFAFPPMSEQAGELLQSVPALAGKLQARAAAAARSYPFLEQYIGEKNLGPELAALGSKLLPRIGRYTLDLLSAAAGALIVLVASLYATVQPRPLVRGFLFALPRRDRKAALRALLLSRDKLQGWVRATFLMMLVVGVMSGLGLWALGVRSPVLFGVLAGLGEAVPTIGPILSAIPPFLITLADDPGRAAWVLVLFLAVQQVENNLLVPRIMASALRLHPVSILFCVLALGMLLGPIGILLATPTCAVVKILYQVTRNRRATA